MEYGKIVKRALSITWRHKVLWVFGIALALFSGGGRPGVERNLQYTLNPGDMQRWQRGMPWLRGFPLVPGGPFGRPFAPWQQIMPAVLGILAILAAVGVVLLIVGIIVRYTSFGALAGMVDEVERTEQTAFRSGFSAGWSRFLRLFAIDLLIGVAVFALLLVLMVVAILGAMIVAGPVALTSRGGGAPMALAVLWAVGSGLLLLLLLVLAALALSAGVTLVREFAFRACVLDGKGVFDSLGASWGLARSRLREGLLMWLLMVGINLALGLAAIPLALLGIGGLVGPALVIYGLSLSPVATALFALPALLIIILVSLLISGIYLTFRSAVWTLTYRELRNEPKATAVS